MTIKHTSIKQYRLHRGIIKKGRILASQSAYAAAVCGVLAIAGGALIVNKITSHDGGAMKPTSTHMKNTRQTHQGANNKDVASFILKPASKPVAVPSPAPVAAIGSSVASSIAPAWTKLPLYTIPANDAAQYAQNNPLADGSALVKRAGETPVATWFGDWDANPTSAVNDYVTAAAQAGAAPVAVLYNIPARDCGLFSAGGVADSAAYIKWVQAVAAGINNRTAVVILEPDALAGLDCLSATDQNSRYSALSQAVSILKANANTFVYLDAGNPAWQSTDTMASRLRAANIAQADGFSLNVANFVSTSKNQSYGDQLSKLVGNKHYVIDTSRNGNGNLSPDNWCNNPAAAFGNAPTTTTGNPLNDALLWVKIPWESDGTCNGGPTAGVSYWQFAVQLARNAGW